jgi:phospholipid/cholesterol/gamma-HCH transport system substrate-binding protein
LKRSNEALVGVVIVIGVVVIALGTMWLQGVRPGAADVEMQAVFESVGQINPGNPVKIRGVRVGRVRRIEVDPGGEVVRVHFRIQEDVPLPPEPVVILSPESMFGDWQAEIVSRDRFPEYRYARPRAEDDMAGYAIPDISQLTATADRISADIEILTERIGIAFSEETAQNIASLIENVEAVTERLSELVSQQAESFTDITDDLRAATHQIEAAAAGARETFERASETLAREDLDATFRDLAVVAANFREVSGELGETNQEVREMAVRIDTTFERIAELVGRVEAGEGTVGRLMQDPAVADHLEGALAELQLLLEDIRENPRRYLRLSIF